MKIRIRPQRISDATRFLEILSNPNFIYFPAKPKSIEEQMAFLRQNPKKRKEKSEFNFSIMCDGTLVGAIGVKIDCHRPYIGEVGFFIDEAYQRKGIAGKAVEHIEKFIQKNTDIKRIEIRMAVHNKASERVAVKSGYKKEGVLRKMLKVCETWHDCCLYSKIL